MNQKLRVLLLGGGGREHALARAILLSSELQTLKVYPGNGGFDPSMILPQGTLGWKKEDKQLFQKHVQGNYDLVVVGPEEPLVNGVADWCNEIGIPCFGPSQFCAQLEGSKDFAKKLMQKANVPTAKHESFTDEKNALEYVRQKGTPIVIKADGLAAGKGVTVCHEFQQAEQALQEIFIKRKFGSAGNKVVIEEFLEGEEASIFAICDGENFLLLPPAQDHKRAYDNDKGPNTGGMGAYCPAPIADSFVIDQVRREIVAPILNTLREMGEPYVGVLYVGLMISPDKKVRVVEFNCRFGDPETQAVLLLIEDDLLEIFMKAATGNLGKVGSLRIYEGSASVVVLAAEGYPDDYRKNISLHAIQTLLPIQRRVYAACGDIFLFHAGTGLDSSGNLVSTGGRILGVANRSKNLKESLDKNYSFLESFPIPSTYYRKDIGRRAL